VRSKVLVRLDIETRAFRREADALWIDLVAPGREPTRFDYMQQLIATYGFDAPLEAALAYTPHLSAFFDVTRWFRSGHLAQDLFSVGLSAKDITGVGQCMIAPFASVAEACGWLYVHQRAALLHDAVRIELLNLLPEVADATSALSAYDGQIGTMWDDLGEIFDEVAAAPSVEDRIVQAAHEAYRCNLAWHHRLMTVPSGDRARAFPRA
jgi:heme oxygenase